MAKQTLFDLLRDALLRGEVIRSGVFARRHGVTRAGVIRALHMFGGAVTMQGQSEATTWVCVDRAALERCRAPQSPADSARAHAATYWRNAAARCSAFADLSAAWGIAAAPIDIPLPLGAS